MKKVWLTCRYIACISVLCLFTIIAISSLQAFAASPSLVWENRYYAGTSWDHGNSIVAVSDGYVVVGDTYYTSSDSANVYLFKTDFDGNVIWSKTIGEYTPNEYGTNLIAINDGFIIIGTKSSYSGSSTNVYLVKTNLAGDVLWEKTFTIGTYKSYGHSVVAVSDGYVILGSIHSAGGYYNYADVYILKVDLNGNLLWQNSFGGSETDYGESVVALADGYAIGGHAGTDSNWDFYLAKTDLNGNLLWTKTYGTLNDCAYSMCAASDGFYLAGFTIAANKLYLVKTDLDGNLLWDKTMSADNARSVIALSDGCIVCGTWDTGIERCYIAKIFSNGTLAWEGTYGTWTEGQSIAAAGDYYVATGTMYGPYYDAFLIKINKEPSASAPTPPSAGTVSVSADSPPVISWMYSDTEGSPQAQFEVEVWTGADGTGTNMWNPDPSSGTSGSLTYAGSALTGGQTYYARVKVYDGTSWSAWSQSSFVASIVPTPPHLNSVSMTGVEAGTPRINWVFDDPEGSPQAGFQVEFRTGAGGTGLLVWSTSGISGSTTGVGYGGSSLTNSLTYYARVRVTDGSGWSDWSEASFVAVVLATPTPTPAPAATPPRVSSLSVTGAETGRPTFNWVYYDPEGSPQLTYKLDVWTGPGGTGMLVWNPQPTGGSIESVTYGGGALVSGQTYYAVLQVSDGTGWSDLKEVSFVAGGSATAIPVPTPVPTQTPGGSGTGTITPTPTQAATPTPTPESSGSQSFLNTNWWWMLLAILVVSAVGVWYYYQKT